MGFFRKRPPREDPMFPANLSPDVVLAVGESFVDPASESSRRMDDYRAGIEEGLDLVIPLALEDGLTPEEFFDRMQREGCNSAGCVLARQRLYAERLQRADDVSFERMTGEILQWPPTRVDGRPLARVISLELVRRGLVPPPPPLESDHETLVSDAVARMELYMLEAQEVMDARAG